jgi:hypothetical protein
VRNLWGQVRAAEKSDQMFRVSKIKELLVHMLAKALQPSAKIQKERGIMLPRKQGDFAEKCLLYGE